MYTIAAQYEGTFQEAIEEVTEGLEEEGFGVLTEIDVGETLQEKLGEEFRQYRILGACNPELAHQAMEKEISIGALLPCNVIVYEDSGKIFVEAADPEELLSISENSQLDSIASEVKGRLQKVVEGL